MATHAPKATSFLFLDHITLQDVPRLKYRLRLLVENEERELQRESNQTWTPAQCLDISPTSQVHLEIQIKSGHLSWTKKEQTSKMIDVEKLFNDYWTSKEHDLTVPEVVVIGKQSYSLELQFSSQNITDSLRSSLHKLEALLKNYSPLMNESTERALEKIIKYGAKFSEVNPIAKVAFSVAEVTFELLQEQNKYDQMPSNLLDRLQRILLFASKVADKIVCEETDILEKTIPRMFEVMQRVAKFSCNYVKRGRFERTMGGLVCPEKIEEMDKELTEIIEDFSHAVNVETLYLVQKNDQELLLKQLRPVETNHNQKRRCMEGTRQSILHRIMNWVPNPQEGTNMQRKDVFWVYGSPGIGKTSLAHSICASLQDREQLAGVFFCRRDDANLSEPRNILPTLIYKLARTFPAFRGIVAEHLRKDPNLTPESMKDTLFVDFIRALHRHPKQHTLVFVIDAFDECGNTQTRRDILKVLTDAATLASWLKIIITSRPEADIIRCFSDTPEKYDLGTDKETKHDLRTFARSQFEVVASEWRLPPTWPEESLFNRVISQANGLFIFINTLVLSLRQCVDPEDALKETLDGSAGAGLDSLYGLYTSILKVQMTRSNIAGFWRVIAVITTAQYRPPHEALIATLAGVKRNLVEKWVDDLSSLLDRDEGTNGVIRTRHLSISEYFISDRCDYKGELQEAHGQLGIVCLETMVGQLRFNICGLEDSRLSNADVKDLQVRIEKNISEPLQYSSLYWSTHLCMTPDNNDRRMLQLGCLKEFFEGLWPLFWIEVLSIMRMVPIGAPSLRRVISWVKDDDSTFLERIRDTCRFILTFHIPIATSAPHTYISTGPFLPSQSPLSSIFSTRFTNVIKVQSGKLASWPAPPVAWYGHTGAVECARYSPDGCHVVTGSRDMTIRIWDAETGAVVCGPLVGHTGIVKSVAYSPDGRSIISGSLDKTIRIWDAETGAAVGERLEGHAKGVNSVAYSPNGRYIISGSNDKTLRIWDAETGTAVGEPLTGHDGHVMSVACSPDERHIISGSLDKTIRIWGAETGAVVCEPLVGHTGGILSVAYSPDGRYIISASEENIIEIWDAETGVVIGEPLAGNRSRKAIVSVAYSPDGRHITSGSWWTHIQIWDAETGALVSKPSMWRHGGVLSVAFSPDGRHIISGSLDNTVRIWDAETGAVVGEPLEGHTWGVTFVACSPDGRHIISGSHGDSILIWDAKTGAVVGKPLEGSDGSLSSVAYSPEGRRVIAGTRWGTIQTRDAETGALIGMPLMMHDGSVACIACSPNGRHITGSCDKTIRTWDAETGTTVNTLEEEHIATVTSVAYSPDGRHIISGSLDNTVRIWDAETGAVVGEPLEGHTWGVTTVACSPDAQHIISGSEDRTIRIWDIETGSAAGKPLVGHKKGVLSVACSPDGQYIISGSADNTIRLWDAKSGTAVGNPLKGHTGGVSSVVYSPDGRYIISGSRDRTIRIWDAVTSAAVGKSIEGLAHSMLHLTTSPHGQDIVSCNDDHSTRASDSVPHHSIRISSDSPVGVDFYVPLDQDGWARDSKNGLLYWVPPDCRAGLHSPALLTFPLTSHIRSVSLDFDEFVFGDSWAQIFNSP